MSYNSVLLIRLDLDLEQSRYRERKLALDKDFKSSLTLLSSFLQTFIYLHFSMGYVTVIFLCMSTFLNTLHFSCPLAF